MTAGQKSFKISTVDALRFREPRPVHSCGDELRFVYGGCVTIH
jgi:hypothetical protein